MPVEFIDRSTIEEAVQRITPYLEDMSSGAHKDIYFDGWNGLAASAVLRAIAEHPPSSLREKFDKIIHIDCSKWKSRRALQKAIAEELKLPQRVMAILDRQDEEDNFSGVEEGSREEVKDVGGEIHRALQEHRCLAIFHNGSSNMIDLNDFGIPRPEWFGNRILWTFRGRLRLNPEIKEKVHKSHLHLYDTFSTHGWEYLLHEEAREIARYTGKLGVTPEIVAECCSYMLSLNSQGGSIMGYNWAMHASNYWVCDGIIVQGGQDNKKAWNAGAALQQELRLEDYSSSILPSFGLRLGTPPNRWIFVTDSMTVPPESTSFFLAVKSEPDHPLVTLPNDMFHQSDKLRVLKLCHCKFNFSSPPFHCCRNLRFLGLDSCKDQRQEEAPKQQQEEEEKQGRLEMDFFRSLWVLDICCMDWELALFPKIIEQISTNIREVYIKKGRIWRSNLSWRRLQNIHKLQVIEPTSSWETGQKDEFIDMEKLELLDLSRNITIQVLPSLSRAVGLKTLVLDGCVELEYVGPEGVPPSLESFSFDARAGGEHNIYRICLAGCARLVNFKLCGPLPNLKELDISESAVQTLDLKDEVVHVPSLQQIILLGCEQFRSILWPKNGLPQLRILHSPGFFIHRLGQEYCHAYVAKDMRFVRSLVLRSNNEFCWKANRFNLVLCISATSKEDVQRCNKKKMSRYSTSQVTGPPPQKSLIAKTPCSTYTDVHIDEITLDHDGRNALQFQPFDCHVEIGEGISYNNVESIQVINAIIFVMRQVKSLHVHDNSSITTIIPERMMSIGEVKNYWSLLKRCRVERCSKLHTVFATNYDWCCFEELETFWATDLPMVRCIWSKGRTITREGKDTESFAKLQSIHLHSCPRLTFVLPLPYYYTLSSLETLHIVYCGDLRQVFPVEAEFLKKIVTDHRKGVLKFPMLKHIYMHDLPSLQQICAAKMSAPMLETIRVRGCWGLRRLPDVGHRYRVSHPSVDCEKDWWEKLEWDGEDVGHDPSLFNPRHPQHYKKPLPKGTVLQ